MANDEIHVFAALQAQPGQETVLGDILKTLVVATQKEPGVVQYVLHEDVKAPGLFFVYEVYRDQAAVDAHMASPHLAEAFAKAGPLLAGKPQINLTRAIAGR